MKPRFRLFSVAGSENELSDRGAHDIVSVAEAIFNHEGWETIGALRDSIRAWGKQAKVGDYYKTKFSLIVAVERDA